MRKFLNIFLGLLIFSIGILIGWFLDGEIREFIRDSYQWVTGNVFYFHGKNLYINLDPFYYLTFGLTSLTMWLCLKKANLKKIAIWLFLSSLFIFINMVVYSLVDGNLKVKSSSMSSDGTYSLHWNDLNYNLITVLSLLFGIAPLIVWTIRDRKK